MNERGEQMGMSGAENSMEEILRGEVPGDEGMLSSLTCAVTPLLDFISRQYLERYIREGGSKIKFLTGCQGSGKTHFSRLLLSKAKEQNYVTVSFSGKNIWLHDFREVYLEILRQCDLERILKECARQIIRSMGYDPDQIREGNTFMDFLSERGEADAISKGEIRSQLRSFFTRNPLLDNSFASCCSLLTGDMLGHPLLEPGSRDILLAFLHGDKSVKLSQLRAFGFSPSRITKFNARHLLRSLSEVIHLAGFPGLLVVVDDLEILLKKSSSEMIHYGKVRRDDTYESIRQLIDDIDSMRHIMFLFCFDRALRDDENYGMKSYQALWMRVQSEVVSVRFNSFADMLDLDRYSDEVYTAEAVCEMSRRLADVLNGNGQGIQRHAYDSFGMDTARDILKRAEYGGLGIPYLVNRKVVEGGSGSSEGGGQYV